MVCGRMWIRGCWNQKDEQTPVFMRYDYYQPVFREIYSHTPCKWATQRRTVARPRCATETSCTHFNLGHLSFVRGKCVERHFYVHAIKLYATNDGFVQKVYHSYGLSNIVSIFPRDSLHVATTHMQNNNRCLAHWAAPLNGIELADDWYDFNSIAIAFNVNWILAQINFYSSIKWSVECYFVMAFMTKC